MTRKQARDVYDGVLARGFDASVVEIRGRVASVRVRCSQCEALVVNGTACHEHGCPHQTHECRECGQPTRNRFECDDCVDAMVVNAEIAHECGRRY